jgi:hypothetical protein
VLLTLAVPQARPADVVEVTVDPARVELSGLYSRYSLLVNGKTAVGLLVDRTSTSRFRSSDPAVARVDANGVVRPAGDGATSILVEADGRTLSVAVTVRDTTRPRHFHFAHDVEPLLSRFGCNASGCHGKAEGQNGFKLSVFGFDPLADYAALTQEGRGRRVFPAAPEQSLVLRKMSGRTAHGGGVRIPAGSAEYETIRGWIAAGMPLGSASAPGVVAVRVEPQERVLEPDGRQRLRVIARYTDGREADVTAHAKFQSNSEAVARVGPDGLVRAGEVPGQAAILAGFMNAVDAFRAVVPRPQRIDNYPALAGNNFIDTLVFRRLRQLNLLPSEPADDSEYLRRVYLDVIGTLPTSAEARAFLADPSPAKRTRLVDDLLRRSEFADLWALRWADLLRVDRAALGPKRAYAYYKWVRDAFAAGKPFDALARELVTAEGPLDEVAPAAFYKAVGKPGAAASTLAQVFLGVRIACAECHHHPFDRWSQTDYYGMQAFFAAVRVQATPAGEALLGDGPAVARNPRTGEDVPAHALLEKPSAPSPMSDRRQDLAAWLTAKDNPFFARNLANRVWGQMMGRGLVEPVDDVRATNPPTHPELLDALATYLIDNHHDVGALIRLITASRIYQLSSKPNATNERDEQNYSRAYFKRVGAEVLLDMVSQVTGVPERFSGMPPGTRAIQLWDSKVSPYFLKVFGRPERVTACECERRQEPSVAQVLHLLNAPQIHAQLTHEAGRVAKLVKRESSDKALVEELYLTCYSRLPAAAERRVALEYLAGTKDRRAAAEDLAWSLVNSLEFLFNH